jgi:aminopeptidase N
MPYTAFLDNTTRNQLKLSQDKGERQFLDQVGPHEVAHQWWGHMVGWKSYRDEWLSEGFADYSAGLFVQQVTGEKKFLEFLRMKKEEITMALPNTGIRANDAGPIYLGERLNSEKTPWAYQRIVYAKGAYVLHMIRMLTYDFRRKDDSKFIGMMHDFVSTYAGREASTEDFRAIVEKHLGANMGWFFNQWVYGTEIPKIAVQYKVTKNDKGAVLEGTVTQRGVSKDFRTYMPVSIGFGDKGGTARLAAIGESTPFSLQLPGVPDSIEFNPLMAILCDLDVKKL